MLFLNNIKIQALLACLPLLFANCVKGQKGLTPKAPIFMDESIIDEIMNSRIKVILKKKITPRCKKKAKKIGEECIDNGKCTGFAYKKKEGNIFRIIVAAHCVAEDNEETKKVEIIATKITLIPELSKDNEYPAKIVAVGYQGVDDDFAILEAELDEDIPILLQAQKEPILFQCVLNSSYPANVEEEVSYGYVSRLTPAQRRIYMEFKGMPNSAGASGSAVVDCYTTEVIGMWARRVRGSFTTKIAIPISRFRRFERKVEEGTYPYFKKE